MSLLASIVKLLGLETSNQKADRMNRESNAEREKGYLAFFTPYIKHNKTIIDFMKEMKCSGFLMTEIVEDGKHIIKALLIDSESGKTIRSDNTNWNVACFNGIKLRLKQDEHGIDYIDLENLLLTDYYHKMTDLMNPEIGPKMLEDSIMNTLDFKMKFTDVFDVRVKEANDEIRSQKELAYWVEHKKRERGMLPSSNGM